MITGGIAALANFGSRVIYNQWMDFSSAIILAYMTGMVTAFVLAKIFVFRESTRKLHQSVLFFVLVNMVAVLQTWMISMLLFNAVLPWMGIEQYAREIAHGTGVLVPVFTSYLGHKHLSFKA
ncbi:GtrA family protein [Larsenimonas rhizosphaerae]|uniref:GtrA family protein n=1 Tax=Larsenimonas rhizosphaerae TaxID=2944682 RepID=UPI0020345815|nr:GtrA family protein [Larsenimonas rhizosphaerae]MCM2131861.1 GtrA family protein [Larsenimonas rhizosphaerae]